MSTLRVERSEEVLLVSLARPDRRNALNPELIGELADAFADVGDARAVVLAGDGESFCAGADVEWMRDSVDLTYEENVADARKLRRMLEAVYNCPAPVIGRIQGHALGGGSGLAACVDVAVSGPDVVFGFTEVKLGIIPAVISPFVLPKIGASAARRYFVTGERFDAEAALRIGLVHELADDLDAAVQRVLKEVLDAGPNATRGAKHLVLEPLAPLETERRTAERRTSDEGQEGLHAFLEKREPAWRSASSS